MLRKIDNSYQLIEFIQISINFLYRHPLAKYKLLKRFGGYFNYQKILKEKMKMQNHSEMLKPIQSYSDGLNIYFLTGKMYLYQTLFCICSLKASTKLKFKFTLVDDGSFDKELINLIRIKLPDAEVVTTEMININIDNILPENEFPILRQKRKEYAHIKKLTDIHTIPGEWKLVLDSDMLFWNEPIEIIEWLKNPNMPLHMIDCEQSYGYTEKLMEELTGYKIPDLVNVGVMGFNSKSLNWRDLEDWTKILEEKEGKTYYLEQALSAMLLSNKQTMALRQSNYKVNPTKEEVFNNEGVLHHYVDLSKEWYFKNAWKKLNYFD
ncbi:hypothetical protein [Pedobacter aquatilis]|uniref:hypothetical protein n=1 Tax=Pedobacter aquatilis TaxID=351343 RepID=UPI00292CFC23|nr:hypothetical protein [Pedobacter aquatilis]